MEGQQISGTEAVRGRSPGRRTEGVREGESRRSRKDLARGHQEAPNKLTVMRAEDRVAQHYSRGDLLARFERSTARGREESGTIRGR